MAGAIVGLHISEDVVRVVALERVGNGFALRRQSERPIAKGEGTNRREALAQAIREAISEMPQRRQLVVANIPGARVSVRRLEAELKDPERLRRVIRYDLEDYVPIAPEDMVADICIVRSNQQRGRSDSQERLTVLTAATERKTLEEILYACQTAGVSPHMIDAEPFGLLNSARHALPSLNHGNCIILHLDNSHATLVATAEGSPLLCRCVGSSPESSDGFARLVREVSLTHHAAFLGPASRAEWRLALAGHRANPELARRLHDALDCDTHMLDLSSAFGGEVPQPAMTIAIGLALRATATTSIGVDLLGVELKPILERTGIRRALMVTAALCLVIGISLLAGLHIRLRLQEQQNASLKAAIRKEFEAVMPGVPIVDELRQLEERLKKVRKEYEAFAGVAQGHFSCVQVLADVGKRFPTGGKVFLRSLTISVPTVQLTGVADTVSAADEVRAALSESALFSEVRMNMVRLDKREGNVQFGITLTLREGWQRAADK